MEVGEADSKVRGEGLGGGEPRREQWCRLRNSSPMVLGGRGQRTLQEGGWGVQGSAVGGSSLQSIVPSAVLPPHWNEFPTVCGLRSALALVCFSDMA